MEYEDVIEHFGSVNRAVAALGLPRKAVNAWRESGMDIGAQYRVEFVTNGALAVGECAKREHFAGERFLTGYLLGYKAGLLAAQAARRRGQK
jgi:DNA-binding transcriptional regulator Cro